ncbi:MAG TPA: hypothetical protein VN634_09055 [Candidatus Limnocylindrales bacterium]|nr:hypothetical protein [Candidatus Limnocylindrales bacterium]
MARRGVEGALFSALQELGRVFGEKRVMNAAGTVLQTAAQTKAAMDDNVSTVLGFAGLPTRGDLEALRRQMDVMQATLANLSRKIDRLIEEAHEDHNAAEPGERRRARRPRAKSAG